MEWERIDYLLFAIAILVGIVIGYSFKKYHESNDDENTIKKLREQVRLFKINQLVMMQHRD